MRRIALAVAAAVVVSILSGCCIFRPTTVGEEPKPLGEMHEVLGAVRNELIKLRKKESADKERIGLTINKITGTFRVLQVDSKAGKLELGITKPVGSATVDASRASTMENIILVEYGWPAEIIYEVCPQSGKDSRGQQCAPGSKKPREPDLSVQ